MQVESLGKNYEIVTSTFDLRPDEPGMGEAVLLSFSPVFKRRYAFDGDLVLGCKIGCTFCYYRMISSTRPYIGTGRLMELASPEIFVDVIEFSKITGDLTILGARGDGSMYENQIPDVLDELDSRGLSKTHRILVLRRAPFSKAVLEQLESYDVFYGTTITPDGRRIGTPVSEEGQLNSLEKFGVDPRRISVEIGPITPSNIEKVEGIAERLREMGWEAAIYRGVSLGSFGIDRRVIIEELYRCGFLSDEQRKTALETGDYFYSMKNRLEAEIEESVKAILREVGLTPYRHTGMFYSQEWGIRVARNRKNSTRMDLYEALPKKDPRPSKVEDILDGLGYTVKGVERVGDGIVRVDTVEPITEDVAMAVGEFVEASIIATNYMHSPSLRVVGDVYLRNDVIYLPPKSRKLVERVLSIAV